MSQSAGTFKFPNNSIMGSSSLPTSTVVIRTLGVGVLGLVCGVGIGIGIGIGQKYGYCYLHGSNTGSGSWR